MKRLLPLAGLLSLVLCVLAPAAYAQAVWNDSAHRDVTAINAASGNVANASAAATLTGADGKVTHICGFSITSTGSTAAAVVSATVTGLTGGTATFTYATVAGATLSNQPLVVTFTQCIPASDANTAIVVTLPALGLGNTNATVNAWGFRL